MEYNAVKKRGEDLRLAHRLGHKKACLKTGFLFT